ncbi:unnamed protein product [Anisakis simplex]|uniref:Riboflavin transporter n=1 Tax=Anisakis simplex TaxID=6269 RepID=A0A0M3K966_ANISI|nr:unnamed protein product [Anisakis simplex]
MAIRVIVYVLVALFGSSSWLSTNSVWMELPLLTDRLPEGWSLPSYLAAVVQIACIGPLIYSILHKCTKVNVPTAPAILALLVFCCVCTALLAFFWNVTYFVFGQQHSVALVILLFGMALVNATSNVLFMPYMSTFHPTYFTAYFVGMGLSALFPSLVSIAQGSSDECVMVNGTMTREKIAVRFGIREYNLVMFVWLVLCTVSFVLLRWSNIASESTKREPKIRSNADLPVDETSPLHRYADMSHEEERVNGVSKMRYGYLLFLMALVNAQMNGIIPSIQSFAAIPYSQATYHLGLTLSNIFAPVACFIPMFLQPKRIVPLTLLTVLSTALTAFIVMLAAMSPTPYLYSSVYGSILCTVVVVVACALHSYLRTVFATVLRESAEDSESKLFWCGVFIQIGSFLGSCLMFPLVNIFGLFTSAPPCPS